MPQIECSGLFYCCASFWARLCDECSCLHGDQSSCFMQEPRASQGEAAAQISLSSEAVTAANSAEPGDINTVMSNGHAEHPQAEAEPLTQLADASNLALPSQGPVVEISASMQTPAQPQLIPMTTHPGLHAAVASL